jgi:hypothetical protein
MSVHCFAAEQALVDESPRWNQCLRCSHIHERCCPPHGVPCWGWAPMTRHTMSQCAECVYHEERCTPPIGAPCGGYLPEPLP